eukprot:224561_1
MMDSILLTHVELEAPTKQEIKLKDVQLNHQTLLDNNCDTTSKTNELLHIMGGIDAVLSDYLNNKNGRQLIKSELYQINELLLSIHSNKTSNNVNKSDHYENAEILNIQKNNTFLQDIFTAESATKIMNVLFSKVTVAILAACTVIQLIIQFLHRIKIIAIAADIINFLYAYVIIVYIAFTLLSLNKTISKLITYTFDFWFKLFYCVQYGTFAIWYAIQREYDAERISDVVVGFVEILLFLILFSYIDGLQISLTYRNIVLVIWAVVLSIYAIADIFYFSAIDDDDRYLYVWNDYKVNFDLLQGNCLGILCIYIWKQAIYALCRNRKSTILKKSVVIEWN